MLCTETGHTLGAFIFEEILCYWGGLKEFVTHNGTPFITALDWLAQMYHILIKVSIVNPQHHTCSLQHVMPCMYLSCLSLAARRGGVHAPVVQSLLHIAFNGQA